MVHPRDRLPVAADYQPATRPFGADSGGPGGLGLAPEPTAAVALPSPTVSAPPGSRMFRVQGRTTGLVLATGEFELPGAFTLPTGQVGVIRLAQFEINGLLLSSDITFRVRLNRAIPTGGRWSPFPTAAAYYLMELPADATTWRVPQKGKVSVTVQVADAGTYAVGTNLQGWYYPIALQEKFDDAWREGL